MHEVADMQATAVSALRGTGIGDHREPFHASVRTPNMTQKRREVHDSAPATTHIRSFRIDQADPFHIPTNKAHLPVNVWPYTSIPSATQKRGEPHDTFVNSLWPPDGGERD